MRHATHFDSLVQYTALAAATAREIADAAQIPFLLSSSTLSLAIVNAIQSVKSHKEDWIQLMEQIHEILCTIIGLYPDSETDGVLPPVLLYDIAKFTEPSNKWAGSEGCLNTLRMSRNWVFAKWSFNKASKFSELVRVGISTISDISHIQKDAMQQHQELLALLAAYPDITYSERSSRIFHGRDLELQAVVDILKQDSARIAILGPGGMGKTSLAIAALHHIQQKITMRGAQHPHNIQWTHPFLPALKPLSDLAALQIFSDIADENSSETLTQLLEFTGNLPLAVSLMASVVAHEGCDEALARLQTEKTRLLSDGHDKRSNLDISIMLSFSSSRMSAGAQQLISILSILPDGLSDADLVQSKLDIPNILTSKATLIGTSLAYIDSSDKRLKVLVPIREHVLSFHPPSSGLKLSIRQHFYKILNLWREFDHLQLGHIVNDISKSLGNLNSILLEALQTTDGPDTVTTLNSILLLNQFYVTTKNASLPLMHNLSQKMDDWRDHPIYGQYLTEQFYTAVDSPIPDAETRIKAGKEYFEQAVTLQQGDVLAYLHLIDASKRDESHLSERHPGCSVEHSYGILHAIAIDDAGKTACDLIDDSRRRRFSPIGRDPGIKLILAALTESCLETMGRSTKNRPVHDENDSSRSEQRASVDARAKAVLTPMKEAEVKTRADHHRSAQTGTKLFLPTRDCLGGQDTMPTVPASSRSRDVSMRTLICIGLAWLKEEQYCYCSGQDSEFASISRDNMINPA
ncbi:hypothetical protein C8R44DRAFT_750873 [Mycena epipterygia]|nr:hypothetical protein C8R44DRAFT_750873 [Mycena epipterygia]